MSIKKFTTEIKEPILPKDFAIVRNLYSPVVGNDAILLYQILVDYNNLNSNRRTFFELSEIQKVLNLKYDQIIQSRMKLEAVGLLRTFEKANNEILIIIINKPLSAKLFRNNSLLYKQYIKVVGEEMFERFEFTNNSFVNNKDDYKETTVKFQDMFDINFSTKQNTLDVPKIDIENRDQAIKGLTTMQFIKYLTNKRISPALMSIVQDLQKIGFSSRSINEIASYSYEVNGKVVAKHVNVIATDLFAKKVTSADEVRVELSHALEARAPKKNMFLAEQNSKQPDLEWDDIFDNLGEL